MESKKQNLISRDMTFAELMERFPEARETLFEMGLMCGMCPASQMESLEGGAITHGIEPHELIEELNKRLVK